MPTIDELPAARSVADSDEMVVSQGGAIARATRGQVLAGVQKEIVLQGNALLGRSGAGFGAPEPVTIGANLSLVRGVLSGRPEFVPASLDAGTVPQLTDDVLVLQQGAARRVSYAGFLAGISGYDGLDISACVAGAAGAVGTRSLAALFADSATVESFGARGDGVQDDTAAFQAALDSGRPLRLGAKSYAVRGALLCRGTTVLLGVPGASRVVRLAPTGDAAWWTVSGARLYANGITFDGGGFGVAASGLLAVQPGVLDVVVAGCEFRNSGADGLVIESGGRAIVSQCVIADNARHGIHVDAAADVAILDSVVSGHGGTAVHVVDASAIEVRGCRLVSNFVGIDVTAGPAVTGGARLCGNQMQLQRLVGLRVAGDDASILGNDIAFDPQLGGTTGIVVRGTGHRVLGNRLSYAALGIDARVTVEAGVEENYIVRCGVGVLLDGAQNAICAANRLVSPQTGIRLRAVEPSLSSTPSRGGEVARNCISLSTPTAVGILVDDGAPGVAVTGNAFRGTDLVGDQQAMWLHTDTALVHGNSWNAVPRPAAQVSGGTLVLPDHADRVTVPTGAGVVQAVLTQRQKDTQGQVLFVRVIDGGAGYSYATVTIGGAGFGAAVSAVIDQGRIAWITVLNPGSGYGGLGQSVPVSISGDGAGAHAVAVAGLATMTGRRFDVTTRGPVTIANSLSQSNWTGFDVQVPARGGLTVEGYGGAWTVLPQVQQDYLRPTGDGGVSLRTTAGGDLLLRPSSGGEIRLASDAEPAGCISCVGRGAPGGVVVAPPGSDYRNLDGGAGATLWLKQTGADASGWVAIA